MRCVLFDLDGTLIETWHLYLESFRRTLEPHFHGSLSDAEIVALQPSAERRLLQRVIGEARFSGYFDQFLTHYSSLHGDLFGGLYAGVQDMLRALPAEGCLLGIVTGKSREAWRITAARLEQHEFEATFDLVLTDDDVKDPKPSPEGLLAALDSFDIPASQAFYVGDSVLDCEAARAAGIPFGAALWSKAPRERARFANSARKSGASASFLSPAAVVDALQRFDHPRSRKLTKGER